MIILYYAAVSIAWILFSAMWCACTVVDSIGAMNAEPSTEPAESTNTDGDSDSDAPLLFYRMDYMSAAAAGETYVWIEAASNSLGLRGLWYAYFDDVSTAEHYSDGNGGVCGRGEIVPSDTENWRYAGLGFSLCSSGWDEDPAYESFTLAECPYVENLADRLVGISFEVTGTLPEELWLCFTQEGLRYPFVTAVSTMERRDYFFVDGEPHPNETTPLSVPDVTAFQFEMWNETAAPIAFDFCITGVQLLVVDHL
ncbi:MAG: hypothetical protein JXR45_19945 [Deltaproteobacteria bacterium]|nr:hypothetical protein [Deltaproteobacteria bacterium]